METLLQEKTDTETFFLEIANETHSRFAEQISRLYHQSAKNRGIGIADRPPEYIMRKMKENKGVIALHQSGDLAGFCYIETFSSGKYVANSGLIVVPEYRRNGLARRIKDKVFSYSRKRYPQAKVFGITTSRAVMKINSELGYRPVTFAELTRDDEFWDGCASCPNYEILNANNRLNCLCTGMLYDPDEDHTNNQP